MMAGLSKPQDWLDAAEAVMVALASQVDLSGSACDWPVWTYAWRNLAGFK